MEFADLTEEYTGRVMSGGDAPIAADALTAPQPADTTASGTSNATEAQEQGTGNT